MPRRFLKILQIENVGVSVEQLLGVLSGRDLTINAERWRRAISLRGRASDSLAGARVYKDVRRFDRVLVR